MGNAVTSMGTVTWLPDLRKELHEVTAEVDEAKRAPSGGRDRILETVADLLENAGYDAVQLREVARRARTSLATIYARYSTRDELILAALEWWMAENRYAGLTIQAPAPGESLYHGLMRVQRTIFEPWERHPGMLKAYFRARSAPGGQRLIRQGLDAVVPAAMAAYGNADEAFVHDLGNTLSGLIYAQLGRFAQDEISATEILPLVERTVFWMVAGYEAKTHPRMP